jgi:hypothetical protein
MSAIIRIPWWGGWGILIALAIMVVPRVLAHFARRASSAHRRTRVERPVPVHPDARPMWGGPGPRPTKPPRRYRPEPRLWADEEV